MQDQRLRHFRYRRHQIVGKSPAQERAVGCVRIFFVKGGTDRLRKAAADLTIDHRRMQDRAAIMHGHVSVDAWLQGDAVDLDPAEVEDEAVAER